MAHFLQLLLFNLLYGMKHKKIKLSFLLLGMGMALQAQQATTAAGGDAIGSGGSISYSIGQVLYISNTGDSGKINEGVQQPSLPTSLITGTILWIGSCGSRDMSIAFYTPGSNLLQNEYATTISQSGTFIISDTPVGLFDIYIKIEGYLQNAYFDFEMLDGTNNILMDDPIPGDLNGDNGVNILDFSVLNAAFGSVSGGASYNYLADMNCDGGVNIVDVSILNGSFGMIGDQP